MHIVKLNATDSTNQYLKELMLSKDLEDFTVIWAHEQLKGKGQMGAKWISDPGKNLTFSVLKKFNDLNITNRFLLNVTISLAIIDALKYFLVPDLSIKWPNDIMSGSTKICGILIENILFKDRIQASVVGIGLNVNQLSFDNLTNVSSMKLLLGRTLNLEEVLDTLLGCLKSKFLVLDQVDSFLFWNTYEKQLFRKNKPSTFKNTNGQFFMGFIRKVSPEGKLIVELEDEVFKAFDLKEIQLMY